MDTQKGNARLLPAVQVLIFDAVSRRLTLLKPTKPGNPIAASGAEAKNSMAKRILAAYAYVAIWIGLSSTVIMYNKYLLAYSGFPYPISLTMWYASAAAE
jgi:hypothetical protein